MNNATMTFDVDESLKNDFVAAAKAQGRAGAEILRELMRDFTRRHGQTTAAEYDAWFRREVRMGLEEAEVGNLIPHSEVEAEAAAWRAEIKRQIAERGHVYDLDFDRDPEWYKGNYKGNRLNTDSARAPAPQ